MVKLPPDHLARLAFGRTKSEAHEQGICIRCTLPTVAVVRTEAGRAEYQLSGLCDDCFDLLTEERTENDRRYRTKGNG